MEASFVRLRSSFILASLGIALAACQHNQQPVAQPDREAANPFKYSKKSSVCQITPIVKEADGSWKTTMTVRSDDGQCEFNIVQPDSKNNFISFGIATVPEHGKTFVYNYDKRTYIRYTPSLAYAGTDRFIVNLLHQDGSNKTVLSVDVTVDNTGVQIPKPAIEPANKNTTSRKKVTRHRAVSHHRKTVGKAK